MPWNSVWPNGAQSVRANASPGLQNTTYTETTMNLDHYWNAGGVLDGHHKKVEMTSVATITLSSQMTGAFYMANKTAIQSPDVQKAEPFNITKVGAVNHVLQMGFRAMAVWTGNSGSNPTQDEVLYTHNIKTQASSGITRLGVGRFQVLFNIPVPSANYIIFGGAIRNSSTLTDDLIFYIPAATDVSDVKDETGFLVNFKTPGGSHHDPIQCWIAVVGG